MSKDGPSDSSFGFTRPVHVITEAKILYLSLDLWPGPYQSVPEVVNEAEQEDRS